MIIKAIFEHDAGYREYLVFDNTIRNQVRQFAEYSNHIITNCGIVTTMRALDDEAVTFPTRLPCED